jgi:hypothetical protein
MKKQMWILLLFWISLSVSAKNRYAINSKLYNQQQLIGSPVITTEDGEVVKISVDETYEFEILLTALESDTVRVNASINIANKEFRPSITTKLGEQAAIEIGNLRWSMLVNKEDDE